MQKSTISKEELKSVCNLLLSKDSLTAEPRPPVLIADTSVSDNTSAPSNTEEPREEIQNHDSSVSDMDEEFLSVLFNLQNAEPDTQHEIGNPIVKSEGLSTKATVTDEGRLQGSLCSKTAFNLSQRVLSEIEIQVLEKGLDFASIQKSINEPELRKMLKISQGECALDGISGISLLKIFLINQRFALNLTGNLLLVILAWNYF